MRGCPPRAGWRRTCSRDVVMAARLGQINATLHISLLVPPVVIVARAPRPSGRSPSAQRQAAAATRGGSTARLRLAGRGGVIPGRRYCEGMQQRRSCRGRWPIRVQFCRLCNAGSEWNIASAPRAAAPAPRGDVCFRRHQHTACLHYTPVNRAHQGSGLTEKQIN